MANQNLHSIIVSIENSRRKYLNNICKLRGGIKTFNALPRSPPDTVAADIAAENTLHHMTLGLGSVP